MSLGKGDIVLVPFPFTDLSQTKLRPAVVLHIDSVNNDITVCFISSQALTNLSLEEFAINPSEPEFISTGLRVASKVRVSRIVTLDKSLVTRRIGKLGISQVQQLDNILIYIFQL